MSHRYSPPLSSLVWIGVAVGANGQSPSFDSGSLPFVSAYGNASAATTITLMYSNDGTNWRAGGTVVLAAAGDFVMNVTSGARFHALQSTAACTVSAVISAK